MSSSSRARPPASVIAVVVIFLIPAALFIVVAIGMVVFAIVESEPSAVGFALVMVVATLIPGMTAQGLWRGYRGSRISALIIGVFSLPSGILILILLTTRSSKEWFGIGRATKVQFPESPRGAGS